MYIYVALLRQINRLDRDVLATEPEFGVAEVALATFLIGVFGFSSLGASSVQIVRLRTSDLILNAVVSIGIVLFVVAFLKLRRFNVTDLTGLAKLSFARTFVTGLVLLIFAYPLIIFADWLTARMLGSGSSRQGIIELFSGSQSLEQRISIILLATVVARIATGAGDDCAVVKFRGAKEWLLLKSDCVVEGIHFVARSSARAVGWKAMMRGLSDFAAMSGVPQFALITLVIAGKKQVMWVRDLYRGLNQAARYFGVAVVGGETSDTDGPTVVVVSVAGFVEPDRCVWRSGGRANDD